MTDQPSAEALKAARTYLNSITDTEHPETHTARHFTAFATQAVAAASRQDAENRALIAEAARLIKTSTNLGGTGKSLEELRASERAPLPLPEPTAEQTEYFRDLAARHIPYDPNVTIGGPASERTKPDAGDLERVKSILGPFVIEGLPGTRTVDRLRKLADDLAAALAEARRAGESAGWDAAEKALVHRQQRLQEKWGGEAPQWALDGADYLATNKPRALAPSPEGRS